jgi:predicted dehydrogenase
MEKPVTHSVGIIMNGVTGRMGMNQHLMRSIAAIRAQGGVRISDKEFIMPEPILVGRNAEKLEGVAAQAGITRWTTDLDKTLADPQYTIYFDAQTTNMRVESVKKAIRAGKHVYCEKPTALTTADAYDLYVQAEKRGVKHGVVQDKLWLPGILKLRDLIDTGFFGKILSVRGEFGYWVFEGHGIPPQRPSWNYRKEDGGGIIWDMLCHWRYVLDNLFGKVTSVSCLARSCSTTTSSRTSTPPGRSACAGTTCSQYRWTEHAAPRWPASGNAGSSPTRRPRDPSGTPTSINPSISSRTGSRSPASPHMTTRSRSSGSSSSAMS